MPRTVPILAAIIMLSTTLTAQQTPPVPLSYYLPDNISYDPAVPTPEAFFGFQVGTWHLQPEQIHAYIRELAHRSPRISIVPMGRSYEQKEILLAVITSERNHDRLPALQKEHLALSDPSLSPTADITSMPVVVWMGYSVHGNEASGSNASVLVAYYLAAARGPEIDAMLDGTIVLFNPSINPDGLNRFASWVNAGKGMVVDPSPQSREHNEPWPGGRTNHYWFDLNRDWMPLQHPESRARIVQYYAWRPNVLTDHHEMGTSATFFFQPGIPSRNNPLVPRSVGELTERIARFHAAALDSIGSLYYSGESFDDFYVGKGSSYPDITGGIGILFEQASSRGHAQRAPSGVLTFPFTIRNQVATSFSTLRAAVALRRDLLDHQRTMARTALEEAGRSRVRAYVFGTGADKARSAALADVLRMHAIDVQHLGKDIETATGTFVRGEAYIVPVAQVQFRLITSLFEQRTEFTDSLFYDVSAWSLPLAFGLPSAELRSLDKSWIGPAFDGTAQGPELSMPPPSPHYAFDWGEYVAPRALGRLFAAGIVPRMAFEPLSIMTDRGERSFGRGTIIVTVQGQEKDDAAIRAVLAAVSREDGIQVYGLPGGQAVGGIDLGSPNITVLKPPSIALLAGPGVSPTDAGELWHLFDERYGFRVTLLDPDDLRPSALEDVTVLLMPGGRYSSLDARANDLLSWVQKGNTLIALEDAVPWVLGRKQDAARLRRDESSAPDSTALIAYADQDEAFAARRVPGAIVSASADLTHPLLFGSLSRDVMLFKTTPHVFVPSRRLALTPVTYSASPLVSGYLHPASISHIAGGGAVAVAAHGRGRIVMFADNPVFRAYWYGTSRLVSNAALLAPYIRVPASDD